MYFQLHQTIQSIGLKVNILDKNKVLYCPCNPESSERLRCDKTIAQAVGHYENESELQPNFLFHIKCPKILSPIYNQSHKGSL